MTTSEFERWKVNLGCELLKTNIRIRMISFFVDLRFTIYCPLNSYHSLTREIFNLLNHFPNLIDLWPCYETIHSKQDKCNVCDSFAKTFITYEWFFSSMIPHKLCRFKSPLLSNIISHSTQSKMATWIFKPLNMWYILRSKIKQDLFVQRKRLVSSKRAFSVAGPKT